MNWLNPSALVYLSLIIPVIIFYLMKLRRKDLRITTMFLWQKVMNEAKVDSFFQKLKFNILLLLQILFILFLVGALVRPFFTAMGTLSEETIFIIDNSASMSAKEGNKTRLDIAKEKIIELVDDARSGNRFMLISASDSINILSGFSPDKTKIRKLATSIPQKDTSTDLKPAVMLAVSLLKSHPDAGIILLGDKMPALEDLNSMGIPNFRFIPIGNSTQNTAITAFELTKASRGQPVRLFIRIENFSDSPVENVLEVYLNEEIMEAQALNLPPGKPRSFVFDIPIEFNGIVRGRISDKDALSVDNEAWGVVRKSEKIRILLVSPANLFIEKILALIPDIEVEQILPSQSANADLGAYHIIIWNNCNVPAIAAGNHIYLGCDYDGEDNGADGIKDPVIFSWEKIHPLMRFVDLSNVSIAEARRTRIPDEARVLIESADTPLAYVVEKPRMNAIHVLFDYMDSDWPLDPSFPIFISNAVNYLSDRRGIPEAEVRRTGQVVILDFLDREQKIKIRHPGKFLETDPELIGGEPALYLEKAGIYKVSFNKESIDIPANLADRKESDIRVDQPRKITTGREGAQTLSPLIKEIWWELAVIALLVLLLEWYIFNQRRV